MQSKMNSGKLSQPNGNINTENYGAILIARIDGGPHALLDQEMIRQLKELVNKADRDPNIY